MKAVRHSVVNNECATKRKVHYNRSIYNKRVNRNLFSCFVNNSKLLNRRERMKTEIFSENYTSRRCRTIVCRFNRRFIQRDEIVL